MAEAAAGDFTAGDAISGFSFTRDFSEDGRHAAVLIQSRYRGMLVRSDLQNHQAAVLASKAARAPPAPVLGAPMESPDGDPSPPEAIPDDLGDPRRPDDTVIRDDPPAPATTRSAQCTRIFTAACRTRVAEP